MDRKKIVIVEGEANIRRLIRKVLGPEYIYFETENSDEALEIIRRQKPDLVLVDILMHKLNDRSLCQRIKGDQAAGAVFVIGLTGRVNKLSDSPALQISPDGYITKPFNTGQLRTEVENCLAGD